MLAVILTSDKHIKHKVR